MGYLSNIEFVDDEIEFEDVGTARIPEAYELNPKFVKSAVLQSEEISRLQGNVMGTDFDEGEIDDNVFEQKVAYLLYDWVASHVRERALVLGLKSEYTVSRTLLRTVLEARMTGCFMNSLADEAFREAFRNELASMKNNEVLRQFGGSDPWEVLDEISRSDFCSTAGILDIINETGNEGLHGIHNGLIRNILDKFQYFDPKPHHEIKQCYSDLSSSVHVHIEESLVRRLMLEESTPFESPTHTEEGLENFLSQYHSVLDIEGVLLLNEYESAIQQNEEIRDLLQTIDYQLLGLTDTRSKLNTILSE